MNLISSKIAKHVDVLKLFTNIALRTVGLQQLLHCDVCLKTHFLWNVTSDQWFSKWSISTPRGQLDHTRGR